MRREAGDVEDTRLPGQGGGSKDSRSVVAIKTLWHKNGFIVIGMLEIKRDGTSEIPAAEYRVYFGGGYSGVKGRKDQHGVGMAVKKETVKKAGKDSIRIECISARFLKAHISLK